MNLGSRLYQALGILGDIDKEAIQIVPPMNQEEILVFGQRIWWLTKRLNKTFDLVKARVRELAESNGSTASQRLDAEDGSFVIVSPQPRMMILRKDADIEQTRTILGDKFDTLFETTITYRPRKDISDHVGNLTPEEINAVMSVVDIVEGPPKVAFRD